MAAFKAFIVAVATIALVVRSVAATNFTVGAPGGSWDRQTNFASWAASKTFVAGDNLIFSYPPQQHNVLEVSKANYDSCSIGSPIATHASGNDVVPLPAAATRYFICGIPGHCAAGMKVAITVVAGGAAAPAPPPAASPSPAPSPPASSSPPPSSSSPAPSSPGGGSSPPPSSPPSSGSPAPTSPPSSSALSPGGATSAPPPPGSSAANGGRSAPPAMAAVGFGIGVLMMLAL